MARAVYLVLALALAACSKQQAVTIRFVALAGDAPITCGAAVDGRQLTDLRFYVHDVAVLDGQGGAHPVTLASAAPWQGNGVALVDLEDGKGACDTGSTPVHTAITGTAAASAVTGLRFTLGVPFALNHADPALAKPPLDQTEMHWHWQAGYKFLRAGVKQDDAVRYLHLGSTGCEGRIGAITACAHPNRITVTLTGFDPAKDAVGVDVAALLTDLGSGVHACQSEPDNGDCAPMFAALGLSGAPQKVFRRVGAP